MSQYTCRCPDFSNHLAPCPLAELQDWALLSYLTQYPERRPCGCRVKAGERCAWHEAATAPEPITPRPSGEDEPGTVLNEGV